MKRRAFLSLALACATGAALAPVASCATPPIPDPLPPVPMGPSPLTDCIKWSYVGTEAEKYNELTFEHLEALQKKIVAAMGVSPDYTGVVYRWEHKPSPLYEVPVAVCNMDGKTHAEAMEQFRKLWRERVMNGSFTAPIIMPSAPIIMPPAHHDIRMSVCASTLPVLQSDYRPVNDLLKGRLKHGLEQEAQLGQDEALELERFAGLQLSNLIGGDVPCLPVTGEQVHKLLQGKDK